jgi:hypothetical protein
MQHFIGELKPENEHFMNVASEGSVMYKTIAEVRTILEKVLALSILESLAIRPSQLISPKRSNMFTLYQLHPLHLHHT